GNCGDAIGENAFEDERHRIEQGSGIYRRTSVDHIMRQCGDCLSKSWREKLSRRARTFVFRWRCHTRAGIDLGSWPGGGRVRGAIVLRSQSKNERRENEADCPPFLRREDENLAANIFRSGAFHSARGLTWRDRY